MTGVSDEPAVVHTGVAASSCANDKGAAFDPDTPGSDGSTLVEVAPVSKTVATQVRGPVRTFQHPFACWSSHAGEPFGCVGGVAGGILNVPTASCAAGFSVTLPESPASETENELTA